MDRNEQVDRLWEIVARFGVDRQAHGYLARISPPFDVSKPNQHDSKSEFLFEKETVKALGDHFKGLIRNLSGRDEDPSAIRKIRENLLRFIDDGVRRRHAGSSPTSIITFLNKCAAEQSSSYILSLIIIDITEVLWEREKELRDQEKEFWSGSSRPPNHWARTIALRLARYVARKTGSLPTIGVSRDGGHPSTEYGRALEEAFNVLGIGANVRNAGRWAVAQLTEDDLQPEKNALAGLVSQPGILGNVFRMAEDVKKPVSPKEGANE